MTIIEELEEAYYSVSEHNTSARRKIKKAIDKYKELQKENETLKQLLKDNL